MVIFVISYIKYYKDERSFGFFQKLGFPVYKLINVEDVDNKIKELKNNYSTIVITNELAAFSGDIIKKYKNRKDINIIIIK